MGRLNPSMDLATADKLFEDADVNKDGFLEFDEFKAAGANHKLAAPSFLVHETNTTAPGFDAEHELMYGGMGAVCAAREQQSYNLWSEKKPEKKAVLRSRILAPVAQTRPSQHTRSALS